MVSRFSNPLPSPLSTGFREDTVSLKVCRIERQLFIPVCCGAGFSAAASIPAIALTVPSGLRNNTSGDLWGVGTNGYAWSSSPTSGSTNAGYLDFNSTNVDPLSNGYRAYGFSVRCVQNQ